MKTIAIKSEALVLPAIGIGTAGYAGNFTKFSSYKGNYDSKKSYIDLILTAHDVGAKVIDTAENYAEGASEEIIGALPESIKSDLFIMTKFSPSNTAPGEITKALNRSLKRLNRDYVDLYQPHWPSEVNLEEMTNELLNLVHEGKIKHIGLSNFTTSTYNEINSLLPTNKIKFLQTEYGPIERSAELSYLPLFEKDGSILVSYSPLKGGAILDPKSENFNSLKNIAEDNNATIAQLILAWVIKSGSVLAIPKASTKERIIENFKTLTMDFKQESFDEVSNIFKLKVANIDVSLIDVLPDGDRPIYFTLEEAIDNKYNLVPGPVEVAKEIELAGGVLSKPIKLKKVKGSNRYQLLEGRVKLWGWRILFGEKSTIPSIII